MIRPQLPLSNNSPFPRPYKSPTTSLHPFQSDGLDPWLRSHIYPGPRYCKACALLIHRLGDYEARALLLSHIHKDHRTEIMAEEHRIAAEDLETVQVSPPPYFKVERTPSPSFSQANSDGSAFDMCSLEYWPGSQCMTSAPSSGLFGTTYNGYLDSQHHLPQGYPAPYLIGREPIYDIDGPSFFMSALPSVSDAEGSPYAFATALADDPAHLASPSAFDYSSAVKPEAEVFTPTSPFRSTRWVDPAEREGTIGPREVDLCRASTPLILEGNSSQSPLPAYSALSIQAGATGDIASEGTACEDTDNQVCTDRKPARKPLPGSIPNRKPSGTPPPAIPSPRKDSPPRNNAPSEVRPSSTRKKAPRERRRPTGSGRSARKLIRPGAGFPTPPPTPEDNAAAGPTPDSICPITGHPFVPKNDYLVVAKKFGMTYKEIRARGGFAEAESTLRGRYRNLTKRSDERVRRPVWHKDDIKLLREAVRCLSSGGRPHPDEGKFTWKQVAEYIANNGGSYRFGNATCSKKWEELRKSGAISP